MSRRYRIKPPLSGGKPPTQPPEIIELISDDDKAGVPLPAYVELTPRSPPLEIIELYPSPLPPPPPPVTRDLTLERLHVGIAALTDDEMKVAHLWLIGQDREQMSETLNLSEEKVKNFWQHMRWKLRLALQGQEPVGSPPGYERKD